MNPMPEFGPRYPQEPDEPNGFLTLLIGGAALLFVVAAIPVWLLILSSSGMHHQQDERGIAGGAENTGGAENALVAGTPRGVSYSPDGSKKVFVQEYADASPRGAGDEVRLYVADADGTNETEIDVYGDPDAPAWSPDGKTIAYAGSSKEDHINGPKDIWVTHPDGSNMTNLTNTEAAMDTVPVWSPEGDKIAFLSSRNHGAYHVCVMNSDGTGLTRVTDNSAKEDVVTRQDVVTWRMANE